MSSGVTSADFSSWVLGTIRDEGAQFSWLEEKRFEWTPATSLALENILNGKTVVLITDEDRKWLERYILSKINSNRLDRPIIPIISIDCIYEHFNSISGVSAIDTVFDMISSTLSDNYFFWYIGKGDSKRADIAKRKDDSYLWLFDEEYINGFSLKSYDKHLDIKLLQLLRIFSLSLDGVMFGEVDVAN